MCGLLNAPRLSSAGSAPAVGHARGHRGVVLLRLVTAGIHAVRARRRSRAPAVVTAVTARVLILSRVPSVVP